MTAKAELERLRASMDGCMKCRLGETRKNIVFGTGNPEADLMLIGEGPGANEDAQGLPFVGRAGQLLDKMLLAAGFSRETNVYIVNMVKCRPPENRDPQPDETAACGAFLREQIRIVAPKVILCLGRVAAQGVMDPGFKVTKQHGQMMQKDGIWYTGTYHPAALLRFPGNKADAFADLLAARDLLAELG